MILVEGESACLVPAVASVLEEEVLVGLVKCIVRIIQSLAESKSFNAAGAGSVIVGTKVYPRVVSRTRSPVIRVRRGLLIWLGGEFFSSRGLLDQGAFAANIPIRQLRPDSVDYVNFSFDSSACAGAELGVATGSGGLVSCLGYVAG